jgi:histidyl-tRNA synthetase
VSEAAETTMGGFPNYDAALIALLDKQAAEILKVFAARGYARVEPPILQPADVFLDRSGEEIRRRTFVLTDPEGNELCLRPDLTIPVCRMHLEQKGTFPARYAYNGQRSSVSISAGRTGSAEPVSSDWSRMSGRKRPQTRRDRGS